MNFARPMTPATTGPVSILIRTSSGSPVSAGREAHDVREEHRDAGTVLGDDSLVLLEARRHRLGEDVEKQALGLGLLEFECVVLAGEFCQRSLARPHEVLKQRVRGRRHAEDVEREERDDDAVGNMGSASGEGRIDRAGDRDEADEGNEPGDGLTRSHEQQCPQR